MNFIDKFLNSITMYRLMLYYLIGLLIVALVLSVWGLTPFTSQSLLLSVAFITILCLITNKIFSKAFKAPTNVESVYITALILALIITPVVSSGDFLFLFWAGVLAMASKYIIAINKKHIFNPAAIAVVLTSIGFGASASWWIGTRLMLPFVLIGGLLVIRKLRRENFIFSFFLVSLTATSILALLSGQNLIPTLRGLIVESPFLFFAFVMITEPATTPPTNNLQVLYGAILGFLVAPQIHLGSVFSTPELALVVSNIFSFALSPKAKIMLSLKNKTFYGDDIVDFEFIPDRKPKFSAGQYMEWTLPHNKPDTRGNRRYFTIASSPTEDVVRLGVKFYSHGSTFKKKLDLVGENTPFVGGQLLGDFTLPKNKKRKIVFLAGGIGVTPYRSMIKYLIDKKEQRPVTLIYSNKFESEIAYKDLFDQASKELGIKTVYTLTELDKVPQGWTGKAGRVDAQMIKKEIPDYRESTYYLSGPFSMVKAFEKMLKGMGIKSNHIVKDYFPGFV